VLKQLPDCFRVAEWELAGGEHIPTLAVSPLPSPLIPVTLLLCCCILPPTVLPPSLPTHTPTSLVQLLSPPYSLCCVCCACLLKSRSNTLLHTSAKLLEPHGAHPLRYPFSALPSPASPPLSSSPTSSPPTDGHTLLQPRLPARLSFDTRYSALSRRPLS
jgi:hypothetical protein